MNRRRKGDELITASRYQVGRKYRRCVEAKQELEQVGGVSSRLSYTTPTPPHGVQTAANIHPIKPLQNLYLLAT